MMQSLMRRLKDWRNPWALYATKSRNAGAREMARRRRQIAEGRLTAANGLVRGTIDDKGGMTILGEATIDSNVFEVSWRDDVSQFGEQPAAPPPAPKRKRAPRKKVVDAEDGA